MALIRRIRLLPLTMAGLALLLLVKAAGLAGVAYGVAGEVPAPAAPVPPPIVPPPAAPVASAPAAPLRPVLDPPASPSEQALLVDLRRRRTELDGRAQALDRREATAAAAEKRLAARLDELTALQKQLEALEAARRDRDEASWRGLVRVYETMKPKDAAVIFNDLDAPVLLQVVDRMKDGRAAAILAAMAPDRARRLTAELSGLRSRANAPPGAAAGDAAPPRAPPDAASPATPPVFPQAAPGASP